MNGAGVLEVIRAEAERVVANVAVSRPVAVFTTTIERLAATASLEEASLRVGQASLVVVAESAVATIEVTETDGKLDVATALGDIPQAVADALEVLEQDLEEPADITEAAVVKIGQLGILAIWLKSRRLVVAMTVRSELRELEPKRIYDEQAFIAAVVGIGMRLSA